MTQQQTQAFAGNRERQGLVAAALISTLLWLFLIELARSAAHLV
jgi:hypothetical protein